MEKFGIVIPPASDFAARIVEELEDDPDLILLKRKMKKLSAVNSDLEADLIDREYKLACCNNDLIPSLLEENRLIRGHINSLSTTEGEIAEAELKLTAGSTVAERAETVEKELTAAWKLEAEAQGRVDVLRRQVQLLESEVATTEVGLDGARSLGFQRCRELVLVQDSDVDLELLRLENEVQYGKILRPRGDGEPEVLYDPAEEEDEED